MCMCVWISVFLCMSLQYTYSSDPVYIYIYIYIVDKFLICLCFCVKRLLLWSGVCLHMGGCFDFDWFAMTVFQVPPPSLTCWLFCLYWIPLHPERPFIFTKRTHTHTGTTQYIYTHTHTHTHIYMIYICIYIAAIYVRFLRLEFRNYKFYWLIQYDYTYDWLILFDGISTLEGFLMRNPVYKCIINV